MNLKTYYIVIEVLILQIHKTSFSHKEPKTFKQITPFLWVDSVTTVSLQLQWNKN